MNVSTMLVLLVVAAIAGFSIRSLVKSKNPARAALAAAAAAVTAAIKTPNALNIIL